MMFLTKSNVIAAIFFVAGFLLVLQLRTVFLDIPKECLTNISGEEFVVDFGEITSINQAFTKFEIVNSGDCDLIISEVIADCHCTVPFWSRMPIKPGSNTFIEVQYNNFSPGFFQQKILVHCNVENSPLLLTVQGNVIN